MRVTKFKLYDNKTAKDIFPQSLTKAVILKTTPIVKNRSIKIPKPTLWFLLLSQSNF